MTRLPLDSALDLCADPQRRRLLSLLGREPPPIGVERLGEVLADRTDAGPRVDGVSHRRRITTALSHVHLPLLDDADVVDYDADERTVRSCHHTLVDVLPRAAVDTLAAEIDDDDDPTSAACALLADETRRQILATLVEADPPLPLDDVVDAVHEHRRLLARRDVELAVSHVHLPKLTAAGIVTQDRRGRLTEWAVDSEIDWLRCRRRGPNRRSAATSAVGYDVDDDATSD